jgi:hypothetical protein
MPAANQSAARKLYARLLDEARVRLDLLETILDDGMQFRGKPPSQWIVRDFGLLELRMLCELIALGCLVAHGDISATHSKRLRKEYSADAIMAEMMELHAPFFPVPMVETINAMGGKHFEANRGVHSLTREDLCALYAVCGGGLHKGNVKKIVEPMDPKPDNSDLVTWTKKIRGLLTLHIIYLFSGNTYLISWLRYPETGRARVWFGENASPS